MRVKKRDVLKYSLRCSQGPTDSETTQADTHIMRMTCQASATTTGGRMFELKAKGEEKGEDTLDKRLAVVQQTKVARFIVEIDGDGAVFSRRFGRYAQCVTPLSSSVVS